MDAAEPRLRRHQRQPGAQGERVAAAVGRQGAGEIGHELAGDALGHEVRRDLVGAVRVRLAPRLEQVGRLAQMDPLRVVALEPAQVFQALHDVVRVPEAHRGRLGQLLEPPGPARLGQQDAHDTGRAGREQRAQRARGGPHVALAVLLDEDVLEGQVAVPGEVDVAQVVVLEDARALATDVDRGRHRIGGRQRPADVRELRHRRADLPRLPERRHVNDQCLLVLAEPELDEQIRGLAADARVECLLPSTRPGKDLPEALGYLPPNLRRFEHVSLAPLLSASAETVKNNETACQAKTYGTGLEDRGSGC